MIEALTTGELIADPQERTTKAGKPFWTATLRVPAGADSILVGLTVFSESAGARLAQMHKGAKIAAAGTLETSVWTDRTGNERQGWRLNVAEILSVHQARKRRETTDPGQHHEDRGQTVERTRRTPPDGDPRWLDARRAAL